jgi:archaellum biogenesis ATPase FlaH
MSESYETFALIAAIFDLDRIRVRIFPSQQMQDRYPPVPQVWYEYIHANDWKSAAYLHRTSATLQIGYILVITMKFSPFNKWIIVPGKIKTHSTHWARRTLATVTSRQKTVVKIIWPYKDRTQQKPIALSLSNFPQLGNCIIGQILQLDISERPVELPESQEPLTIIPVTVVLQAKSHIIQYMPFETLEEHLQYWSNLLQVSLTHENLMAKRSAQKPEIFNFEWDKRGNPFQLHLSPVQKDAFNIKANSAYKISVGDAEVGQGTVKQPKLIRDNSNIILTLPTDAMLSLLSKQPRNQPGSCILSASDIDSTFSVASKTCRKLFALAEKVPLPNVFHMPVWQQLIGFELNNTKAITPPDFYLRTPTQKNICKAPYTDIAYQVLHGTRINPLSIIFGPPGAGKTTLLVALIYHTCIQNPREQILVTAMTNTAIDNTLEKLQQIINASDPHTKEIFKIVRILPYSREDQARNTPQSLLSLSLTKYPNQSLDTLELIEKFQRIEKDSQELGQRLQATTEQNSEDTNELRALQKEKTRIQTVLEEAYLITIRPNIVFATVITAHNKRLQLEEYKFSPQSVFLDEACQINIPLTLTALQMLHPKQEKRIVLTGDVMQLAAVTMSRGPISEFLSLSLAEFLTMKGRITPFELNITYRSHPNLLKFPAMHFYPKGLYSGTPPEERETLLKTFPFPNSAFPILFISHDTPEEQDNQRSKSNSLERRCIIQLYALLRRTLQISANDIGIISFYSSQVNKLLRDLQAAGFSDVPLDSVATAEKFQGKEKAVVLISCVRSSKAQIVTTQDIRKHLGFLDTRRLISAITRAKSAMFIIGNARHLSHHSFWDKYVKFCLEYGLIINEHQFQQISSKLASEANPTNWTRRGFGY